MTTSIPGPRENSVKGGRHLRTSGDLSKQKYPSFPKWDLLYLSRVLTATLVPPVGLDIGQTIPRLAGSSGAKINLPLTWRLYTQGFLLWA